MCISVHFPRVRHRRMLCRLLIAMLQVLAAVAMQSPCCSADGGQDALQLPGPFTELCDVLAALNFKLISLCDFIMETRDTSYCIEASTTAYVIPAVLEGMKATPEYAGRVIKAVEELMRLSSENQQLITRLDSRLDAYIAEQRVLHDLLEEVDSLVQVSLLPMLLGLPRTSDVSDIVYAVCQARMTAWQMAWGTAREITELDANAGQKARKSMRETLGAVGLASSLARSQVIARKTSPMSVADSARLAELLDRLGMLLRAVEAQATAAYSSWSVLNRLHLDLSSNAYTIDKYIMAELLGTCFF